MATLSMNSIIRFVVVIVSMIISVYVMKSIFAFFKIGTDVYGIYLLSFIALAILIGVLPQDTGSVFRPE